MRSRGLILVLLASIAAARPAGAHQSTLTVETLVGSAALMELGASGHWGFSHRSPWYVFANVSKGAVPVNPREDTFRYGAEAGAEGRRFGVALSFDRLMASGYELAVQQFGGSVRYRFIPFTTVSREEQDTLNREDRQALREAREREMLGKVPRAPVLMIDYDIFNFNSPFATDAGMQGTRIGLTFHWKFHPKLTLFPRIESYGYLRQPRDDLGAGTVFQSHALRLTRIGVRGAYSGMYGAPKGVQQLFLRWTIDSIFSLSVGATRVQLDSPAHTAASLWLGFNRRLQGRWAKWTVSPTYEHVKLGPGTLAFFSARFTYEFNDPYQP
jgi:hypothetical protein